MKINNIHLTNKNAVGQVKLSAGNSPLTGPTGSQGSQGFQGTQGAQGVQGAQGLPGTAVAKGDQGYQGVQGSQGFQGFQGSQGTPGTAVAKGDQGYQGVQGATGSQGVQGAQGSQGLPGTAVSKGDKGNTGAQGAQGAQGERGQKGEKGSQGFQGSVGAQGTIGAQGSQGVQGTPGYVGADGAQGSQGYQGRQGEQGSQGYQGRQGAQGVQGATGAQGVQGDIGPQGIQGSVGSKGDKGNVGAQGAKGDDVNSTAAYNQANAAYAQANSGYSQANSAYTQANAAYTQANSGYAQANSAYDQANAAYTKANTANDNANTRVLKAGDTMTGNLNVEATIVSQNIVPFLDETYDLGTPEKKFRSLYLAGQTIYLGNTSLSTSNNDEVIVTSLKANTLNLAGYNVETWITDTTERANLKVQTIQGPLLSVTTSNTNNVVIANITIRSANTTQNGVVQLYDSTNSESVVLAATANAVKTTYDLANTASNDAYDALTQLDYLNAYFIDLSNQISAVNSAIITTANTVRVSANGGSTLGKSFLNFTNTADVLVSVTPGAGAAANNANVGFTLRSVGVSAGTYGDSSNVASITVDSKGRVTSVSNVTVVASQAIATAAYDQANAAYDQANAAYTQANTTATNSSNAYNQANAAYSKANAAYDSSNTKVADIIDGGNISIGTTTLDNVVTYSVGVSTASVSTRGVTKLVDSISSTDSANAATANAVKTAYDLAYAALPKVGGTISGDLTVSGNLAVLGDSTVLNVSTIKVEDNEIILNSSVTGSPALNALLTVNRGSSTNVALRWNESTDKWEWTDDGITYTAFSSIAGSGPQGAQGVQGAIGDQGTQGVQGATGAQGIQGAAGTNGTQGAQGAQGVQGAAGNDTVPIKINDSAIGTRKTLDFRTANSSNLTITGTDDPTNNKVILIFDNPKLGGSGGVSAYGNTELYISDTPPGSANSNTALWWRANTGKFYIYYNDGDSTQWVSLTPSPIVNTSSNLLFSDANTAASIAAANTLNSQKSNRAGDTFTGNVSVLQNSTKLNISSTLIESNNSLTLNASEYKVNTITFSANTGSTSTAAQTVVDMVSITDYRTVKYTIQIKNGSSYHATEIMVLHDGTSTYMTEYGTVVSGISLGDFSTDISSGKMRLLFDPVFPVNTLNISRISMPA